MKYEICLHSDPIWDVDASSTILGDYTIVESFDAADDVAAVRAVKAKVVATLDTNSQTGITTPHPDGGGKLIVRQLGHGTASICSWMTKRGLMVLVPAGDRQ